MIAYMSLYNTHLAEQCLAGSFQAQYGLTRVSMCGSSMGAYAALELAARRPKLGKNSGEIVCL